MLELDLDKNVNDIITIEKMYSKSNSSQVKLISKQMTYGCREVASNHREFLLF